jgi:transposase, IS6 family
MQLTCAWRAASTYFISSGRRGGATIDFYLCERRDAAAAKHFFRKGLAAPQHTPPRVINVDGNPSYPKVVEELPQEH